MKRPPKKPVATCNNPGNAGRVTPLMKIKGTNGITLVVLSPKIIWYGTHWVNNRTVPCRSDGEKCTCKHKQAPRRWKGYLSVTGLNILGVWLVEVTPNALDGLESQQHGVTDWRGHVLRFRREREAKNSPLLIEYVGPYPGTAELMPPHDPRPTLERMWGE